MARRESWRRLESLWNLLDRREAAGASLPPRRLQTAQDVIDLLQEQVEAVRREHRVGTVEKARAIAYLAGVARKAIEAGIMAERIEMLELVLKQRAADERR